MEKKSCFGHELFAIRSEINETMRDSDLPPVPFSSKSLHNPNKCLTFATLEPPSLLTMLKSGVVLFLTKGHGDRYIGSLFRGDEPVPDDLNLKAFIT